VSRRSPAPNVGLSDILAGLADLIAERVAANLAETLEARSHPTPSVAKQPDFLDEHEVARRSSISVRTLQGWRLKGRGPRFVRAHRKVLYPRIEFETWLRSDSS
jgi:hypothetical protein